MRRVLPLLMLVAAGAFACAPMDDEEASVAEEEVSTAEEEASVADEEPSVADDACLDVPAQKVEHIEAGLAVRGGGSLRDARAVRSGAHQSAYFVSGDLEGPGLEGPGHLATWFVTELEERGGLVFSVSGQAKEFSDWGDASTTDARATMSDPGARESQNCVPE